MSISDLPVELHTSILKHLLSLSRQPAHGLGWNPDRSLSLPPVKFEWINSDTRSASLFPFNVVSVSKLWRDILALIPECWTRIVFDVAKDPTHLLDAFLWSENVENLEVFIFNSDSSQTIDKMHERSSVSAIAKALYPHVHRCISIVFDVTYATSLPSPTMFFIRSAPRLEELCLDCSIDNLDHNREKIRRPRDLATSFPKLKMLSLTGFWFMDLVLHARSSDWFKQLSLTIEEPNFVAFSISRFTFPRHGQYSLAEFVSHIASVNIGYMGFRDLSLAYAYDDLEPKPDCAYNIRANSHFQSVSKDFLVHLDTLAEVRCRGSLSFEECEVPKLNMVKSVNHLDLTHIVDDDEGTSLRNILEIWTGSTLSICSCPSFNDKYLSWLASEKEHTISSEISDMDSDYFPHIFHHSRTFKAFPAKNMSSLSIISCKNITSRAVRELIRVRNEAASLKALERRDDESTDEEPAMNYLYVGGRGPVLADEDKRWFEQNSEQISVHWGTTNERGKKEKFSTTK